MAKPAALCHKPTMTVIHYVDVANYDIRAQPDSIGSEP